MKDLFRRDGFFLCRPCNCSWCVLLCDHKIHAAIYQQSRKCLCYRRCAFSNKKYKIISLAAF